MVKTNGDSKGGTAGKDGNTRPVDVGTMTDKKNDKTTPALRIEQVAQLCGVSVARVQAWIEKNGLTSITVKTEIKVGQDDLARFLMRFNMPIPAGILPVNAKKVLFVGPEHRGGKAGARFFQFFSEQFRRKANCFLDCVTFGKGAEYKILTFLPDLILADAVSGSEETLQLLDFVKSIGGMRTVVLVRRNLARKKREKILAAGTHAVIERNLAWEELHACFTRVFNSLGSAQR
jgi:hypothetical protein